MCDVLHIVLAMKPLEGNFVENAIEHGVAGLNVAASRIQTPDEVSLLGRFPTNVILSHSSECEHKGSKRIKNSSGDVSGKEKSQTGGEGTSCYGKYNRVPRKRYGNDNSEELVDDWSCSEDCPVNCMESQRPNITKLFKTISP